MSTDLFIELSELTALDAPTGFEEPVLRVMRDRFAAYTDTVTIDVRGNLYATTPGAGPDAPTVMLIAHADEIGFLVTGITPGGFLRFTLLGGPTAMTLPGRLVRVLGPNCPLQGVIGVKPGHVLSGEAARLVPETHELYIDVGAESADEVRAWGIGPGTPAVFDAPLVRLNNQRIVAGKAVDDRAGLLALLLAAERLSGADIAPTVVWCCSVEEETGLRGAEVAAKQVRPDVVIAVDTIPAGGTPDLGTDEVPVAMGAGPFIKVREARGLSTHRPLRELFRDVAVERGIPHQYGVDTAGITDATAAQQAGGQVAALSVCIPRRYSHSAVEMLDLDDVASLVDLLSATIPLIDDRAKLARL